MAQQPSGGYRNLLPFAGLQIMVDLVDCTFDRSVLLLQDSDTFLQRG